ALLGAVAGLERGLVLGLARDDVVAAIRVELGCALEREVRGLRGTRRPHELAARGAEERGDLIASELGGLLRRPAERVVAARGVAEVVREVRDHRLEHARIDRRRR